MAREIPMHEAPHAGWAWLALAAAALAALVLLVPTRVE